MADFERELMQADYDDRSTRGRWLSEAKNEESRYMDSQNDVDDLLQWTSKKPDTEIVEDLLDFSIEQQGSKKDDLSRFHEMFAQDRSNGGLIGGGGGLSLLDMMEATKNPEINLHGGPVKSKDKTRSKSRDKNSSKPRTTTSTGQIDIQERYEGLGASDIFMDERSSEIDDSLKVKAEGTGTGSATNTFSKHTNVNILSNLVEVKPVASKELPSKRVDSLNGYFTKTSSAQDGDSRQVTVVDSRKILKKQENSKLEAIKAKYRRLAAESKVSQQQDNTEENVSRKVNVTFDEIYTAFISAPLPSKLDIKDLVWDNRRKKFDIISSNDVLGKRDDQPDFRPVINLVGAGVKYTSPTTQNSRPVGIELIQIASKDTVTRNQGVIQKSPQHSQVRINQVKCPRKSIERVPTYHNKIIPEVEIFNDDSDCENLDQIAELDSTPIGGLALLGGTQGNLGSSFKHVAGEKPYFNSGATRNSTSHRARATIIEELNN